MIQQDRPKGLRLVSFDGGGVQGLWSLLVLQQLMESVGNPLPWEHFDMMAGTSTGALIAIMLGVLRLDVKTCIELYVEMMDDVCRQVSRCPVTGTLKLKPRYSSQALKRGILKAISKAGFATPENVCFRPATEPACKVVVVATCAGVSIPTTFTSYRQLGEPHISMFDQVKIWEVALASTAAPTMFEETIITYNGLTSTFVEGAVKVSNPVDVLWQHAEDWWMDHWQLPTTRPGDQHVCCIVSVGTGLQTLKHAGRYAHQLIKSLAKMATETRDTNDRFHSAHRRVVEEGKFFRFDLPTMEDIQLRETVQKDVIAARVRADGETGAMRQLLLNYRWHQYTHHDHGVHWRDQTGAHKEENR
ncbi:acyl transferase/acyl hydrolase/lysophospholipase [Exophiala viscosa]|uniref:acyl transferase/acyl hydrolase/lysophospholipase n=1 Tax=Exophiala viscosa TaxID=2486360 RepID=UPI0021A0770D|nr:acyl transferase/acyl hydrolase/lysophospholipase [Exophiala viscosa]